MRHTKEQFIEKAKQVHGDKYNYELVEYKNTDTKVKIICPIHGVFEQSPYNHANRGRGCPKCANEHRNDNRKLSLDGFIKKAQKVHGTFYDYSLVEYKNNKTKVKIICPEHGVFEQTPDNHLSGQGCPYCSGNVRMTKEEFICRASKVHGNKYDYSEIDYKNNRTKVKIICPEHGPFYVSPWSHLNGHECPECGKLKQKQTIKEKYGVEHYSQTDEFKEKYKETCLRKYGVNNYAETQECIDKIRNSKRENNTFSSSAPEDKAHEILLNLFGEDDVERHYNKDVRYPFACDFYIKSLDLFIELNLNWTHGPHWFDKNNPDDIERLEKLQEKASNSHYYENAVDVWIVKDVIKKETAEKNNLNYLAFWKTDLSDFYEWLESIADVSV